SGGLSGPNPSNSPGGISSFSGVGPTRDGRVKPDVAAPGEWVGSTLAGAYRTSLNGTYTERDGQHGDLRGTSMATPHVAGVAALLLGLNPALDGPQIKAAILLGAQIDEFTGPTPNVQYGYGKLRAPEAGTRAVTIVTGLAALVPAGFAAPASLFVDSYNVYRGTIPGISGTDYGTCFLSGLPSPVFDDAETPFPGQAFFYLVTGVRLGVEGILGTDSDGKVRPPLSPCP
ncbi:MAG TPA: S8 family serine peptidase, partial [Candidatus Polarisedimenticolia bacterium]|nr:S8 family serine peptidase [Candidatus Polarisedimenticolia bacterium]